MKQQDYTADEVYGSFQNPQKCRELVRMLLNSGLLADILAECSEYVEESDMYTPRESQSS